MKVGHSMWQPLQNIFECRKCQSKDLKGGLQGRQNTELRALQQDSGHKSEEAIGEFDSLMIATRQVLGTKGSESA